LNNKFKYAQHKCANVLNISGFSSAISKTQTENIYANFSHKDQSLQLHKLSDDSIPRTSQLKPRYAESGYLSSTSKTSPTSSAEASGSHLSLTSSSGCTCSTVEEKYEAEIRKLNKEMESYRATITKLTEKHDGYNNLIQFFENKLNLMAKHLENLNGKSQLKKDEVSKLRAEIDSLRVISSNTGVRVSGNGNPGGLSRAAYNQMRDGSGELLRQPSLESINSHRSSMSSSSKGSKGDKSSLNSFGKQGKKSWGTNVDFQIRSSFTRAFTKNKKPKNGCVSDVEQSAGQISAVSVPLKPISGSTNKLDEIETVPQVVELKKQLEDKDSALTDVRLDALDKAREVDILKETINRLKTENKILKQNYNMLERRMRNESRASSQQSLPTLPDEDPVYEMPPNGDIIRLPVLSKSSVWNCDATFIRVTVSVDFSGNFLSGSASGEISIGGVPVPNY
uniref:AAA domain-containing protein n=1 Tax=Syphacia muris TaxID=451379 RepID=A0A0N5A9W3_9BILA